MPKHGFKKGVTNSNLYVKSNDGNLIMVVVYVDDIVFGSDSYQLTFQFSNNMKAEFEMFMLGETERNPNEFLSHKKSISSKYWRNLAWRNAL